ncbi:MAG: hypothetical protein Q9161_004245 [Pseudevernia consocians]
MHFLQLLPFASLVLAVPSPNINSKRQSSCTSEPWAIQQYHTCTNCTYPGSTQETTSLVFNFVDPNFNPAVTATCELSLLPGSSLIDFNYTPCGSGVAFYYDGADLNVERTGVECGKLSDDNGTPAQETPKARSRAARYRHVLPTSSPPPPLPSLTLSLPGADKTANLARARSRVLEASKAGASLIVLPECFNSPYGCQYFPSYAETLQPTPPTKEQSPSFHALSALALESKSYLLGGSIPEYVESTKKYHNTSLLFSPKGDLLATHRKVHLFDIDIPGKITFRESDVLSPGNKLTLVDIPPYGKIALAICYDIRFPELATIAARKGCFLLLYPGAFNLTTGALHWELQARARAVDNQVYVGLCSPARDMDATYHAWGHSMVVDPNASVMCEAGEVEEIVYADLNGEKIEETRKGIPIYTQRRFDVYPDVSEGKIKFDE